jgi:beta-lactamase regulating signal transducer with metallopeptidase domain
MNAVFAVHDIWQLAGWTMLHYLWIGAALGLAAFAVRRVCQRLPAHVRYGAALVWLVLLAAAPFGIAAYLIQASAGPVIEPMASHSSAEHLSSITLPRELAEIAIAAAPPGQMPDNSGVQDRFEAAISLSERIEQALQPLVRWLAWIWVLGTPLCMLVVASGLYGAERMRRGAMLVIEGPVAEVFEHARTALSVGRAVAVAVSDRIVSPLVLGIVKPLILLPASAVAGWTPDQLQMILLHELAHVRRWDNLVNLVQRIVEAALFFQPAVWLVSNWVRLERELCCDAVVLAQGNEPQDYAETLASLAMPGISPRYAAAALASHQLVSRIRHILKVEDRSMKISRRAFLTLVCGAVLCSGLVAVYANQHNDGEPQCSRPN